MPQPSEACGPSLLPLLAAGLGDRLRGNHRRANARWGHMRPPTGAGKVIWLKTGADEQSVYLGAELLAAIRHKRLDVRLVLTFEHDYSAMLNQRLGGLAKTALGYGPCDARRAVRRTLNRLDPFAIIWVDAAPEPNLLNAANADRRHTLVVSAPPGRIGQVEAAYPATPAQARRWQDQGSADHLAPATDFRALLVEAQVEATLRGLSGVSHIGWVHGADAKQLRALASRWRRTRFAEDGVLFVSCERGNGTDVDADLLISEWKRTALPAGTVVEVNDRRWVAPVAAAAQSQHLFGAGPQVLWQALAAGTATSISAALARELSERMIDPPALTVADTFDELLACWEHWQADPPSARLSGDQCRRRLWLERRRAGQERDDLLQRVFDW